MTTLAAKALDFGNRDSLNAGSLEGFFNVVDLEWFHYGCDEFHVYILPF
jgi:D-alanyl-D-alanine dipeptidase